MKKLIVFLFISFLTVTVKAQLNPAGYVLDESRLVLFDQTVVVSDVTAYGGSAIYRPATAPGGTAWYGPYTHLQGGNYLMQVRLKVSSNSSGLPLINVDMVSGAGGAQYAVLNISPNMFRNSNEWQLFSIPVQLPDNLTDFETRGVTFQSGVTDLYLDYINIIPADARGIYSNEFSVTGTGKVGIGTMYPTSALDIGGAIQISSINQSTPPPGLSYGLFPYGGVGLGIFSGATDINQGIGFWTNPGGVKTETMRIASGGNLGVGTTSPDSRLTVLGGNVAVQNNLNVGAGDGNGIKLYGNTGDMPYRSVDIVPFIPAGAPGVDHVGLNIYTANGVTNRVNAMTILDNGNVAIGTSDPKGYKLAVAGNAIAQSMTVKLQANWPDIVFKKDYALMPLSDVKTYIDKNQHLPEIPAAAEVEKYGVNLGEMNRLLVKKVEELTLYLIQQKEETDKQSKSQQQQIDDLKQQLNALTKSLNKN